MAAPNRRTAERYEATQRHGLRIVDHPYVGIEMAHLSCQTFEIGSICPLVVGCDLARLALQPIVELLRNREEVFIRGLPAVGNELHKSRESLRTADTELAGSRAANERLRRELEHAIDRANEAEERVRQLTTPVQRDYE
jgi:hypothetical protein